MDIFPVVPGMTLELGKTGTHYVRAFRFDISAWQEAYPDGIINLIHRLPDANEPYVAGYLRLGEGYIDWVVQSSDVAVPGYGECELVMIVDGVAVDKTDTYPTHIEEQLGTNSVTPPTSVTWVEQVLTAGGLALQAVNGFEDLVAEKEQGITDLAAQEIAAIEAKGAETLDSIPEDYTQLSAKVGILQDTTQAQQTQINSKASILDLNNEITRAENEEARLEALFTAPTQEAVNRWLDAHPEATTTVQDHSLTHSKLVNGTLGFVTPEMYGAVGDGITDDYNALNAALQTGKELRGTNKVYYCSDTITSQKCQHVVGLRVVLAPMAFIAFHADHFLMENCEFDHGNNYMEIEGRGEFLVACYGSNVEIANSFFHDTVSALFCGFEQEFVNVHGCHFKNCKESLDALTRGVNGYAIVTDAVKNLIVHDNLFEDVYRHSVYISMSDINTQLPTARASISNNIIVASDRNADRYVTGYEVPIMSRTVTDIEVTNNIFENMYGGCFTFGGEYKSGNSNLNFHDNTVVGIYNIDSLPQYGIINMLEYENDANIAVIHDNIFRNCSCKIVNADVSNKVIINSNEIEITDAVAYVGYNHRDDVAGSIIASNNHVITAAAFIVMYQISGEVAIVNNRFDSSTIIYSNSGQKESNELVIIKDNYSKAGFNINLSGVSNLAIINNYALVKSYFNAGDATLICYGNNNVSPLGIEMLSTDTIVDNNVSGESLSNILSTVFARWSNLGILRDHSTVPVSISASGAASGQYSGFINVTSSAIRFCIIDGSRSYNGAYNRTNGNITIVNVITPSIIHNYSNVKYIATNTGTDKTIEFGETGTHMVIIAERFNSVTLVYFNGENVFTLAIAGTAHVCSVVNNKAITFTPQYSARALLIADTFNLTIT